jgi:hypothetical protein
MENKRGTPSRERMEEIRRDHDTLFGMRAVKDCLAEIDDLENQLRQLRVLTAMLVKTSGKGLDSVDKPPEDLL